MLLDGQIEKTNPSKRCHN